MNKTYEYIESLCKEKGITVTELCRRTGASRSALSDLKRGRSFVLSAKTMRLIADYFGVSTDNLMDKDMLKPMQGGAKSLDFIYNDISRLGIQCGENAPILAKAAGIETQKKHIADALSAFCSVDKLNADDLVGAEKKRETLEMIANIVDIFFELEETGREKLMERAQELRVLGSTKYKVLPAQD